MTLRRWLILAFLDVGVVLFAIRAARNGWSFTAALLVTIVFFSFIWLRSTVRR